MHPKSTISWKTVRPHQSLISIFKNIFLQSHSILQFPWTSGMTRLIGKCLYDKGPKLLPSKSRPGDSSPPRWGQPPMLRQHTGTEGIPGENCHSRVMAHQHQLLQTPVHSQTHRLNIPERVILYSEKLGLWLKTTNKTTQGSWKWLFNSLKRMKPNSLLLVYKLLSRPAFRVPATSYFITC